MTMPDHPGKTPDLLPPAQTRLPPLQLPRDLMRRAAAVALAAFLLALVLGLWRAERDIDDELRAALSLAATLTRASGLNPLDETTAVDTLRARANEVPLRHVSLTLHDGNGRLLLARGSESPAEPLLQALAQMHARWRPAPEHPPVRWLLPRTDRSDWTLTLAADAQSERREALGQWLVSLALLATGTLALLGVMQHQVRRALRPLQALLHTISGLRPDAAAWPVAAAPSPSPAPPALRELKAIEAALQGLRCALQAADDDRRLALGKLVSLQEDERAWLARELHDELGQSLTALRLQAALLQRLAEQASNRLDTHALRTTAHSLQAHAEQVQTGLGGLLDRLAPQPGEGGDAAPWLHAALQALVQAWAAGGRAGPVVTLHWNWDLTPLPPAWALALYRISQEALTNVARHAQATQASLRLRTQAGLLHWSVHDNGCGLADAALLQGQALAARGTGLAGMRQRLWALGSDLHLAPMTLNWAATPAEAGLAPIAAERAALAMAPGLMLSAELRLPAAATVGQAQP